MIKKYICEKKSCNNILQNGNIYFKWLKELQNLMKYLVDCTISMKSLTHVIPQKTCRQVFHSNDHKCVEKNHFVEKIFSFEKLC
jgi:hypothetical protein